jgi:hypothetical protein
MSQAMAHATSSTANATASVKEDEDKVVHVPPSSPEAEIEDEAL